MKYWLAQRGKISLLPDSFRAEALFDQNGRDSVAMGWLLFVSVEVAFLRQVNNCRSLGPRRPGAADRRYRLRIISRASDIL
jgi:hypothetical protein